MEELFQNLESNDSTLVDDAKQKIHEQLTLVKESWLLNGLYDYYLATNSVRSMEVLINIREPHYLFERLGESLKGSKTETKIQALTLLGHVVRKQPTWLYKITNHTLFKEILKLLKQECDIVLLLSALLALIVLLPCIPSLMKPYLQDVFEIFSRLAAWNSNTPDKLQEEQMVHMQVSLCALFQRLYGMYPCNFLTYLREYYRNKERLPIFNHTIKPMLQRVQMHPLLVTTSKDHETAIDRWKKMSPHDVVVECESFSLDMKERFSHETCFVQNTSFRSRSGTTNSTTLEMPLQFLKQSSNTPVPVPPDGEFFSPSMILHSQTPSFVETTMPTAIPHTQGAGPSLVSGVAMQSQEGTSPPEAAIEATPETTPIKDVRSLSSRQQQQHLQGTTVARALNQFHVGRARSVCGSSTSTTPTHSQPSSPMRKDASTFNFNEQQRHPSAFGMPNRHSNQRLQKLLQDRSQVTDEPTKTKPQMMAPTSPLHIIPPSYVTLENHAHLARMESPISQEDEEVVSIVGQGEIPKHHLLRQCDSVLYDAECRTNEEEIDDTEHGSPCTSGGLHMPNSKQMDVFRKKISRLRSCSQSDPNAEPSDPYNLHDSLSNTVRRANSCPEMKKGVVGAAKECINAKEPLEENEEEVGADGVHVNGLEQKCKKLMTSETQTENFWPMPYEHLFLSVFPSIDSSDTKTTPAPSPAPCLHHHQDKFHLPTIYDILDRYTDVAVQMNEKDTIKNLKDQQQLLSLQLLFERHRRETHASRNRTLFIDVTDNRVRDELNSALTDQVKLQESLIVKLKHEIGEFMKERHMWKKETRDIENHWENKYLSLQRDCNMLKERNDDLMKEVSVEKAKVHELDTDLQNSMHLLFNAEAEVVVAKEQVAAADKCRVELEKVNRELLLAGELVLKYEERLAALDVLRRNEEEQNMLTEAYQHELRGLQLQLESKMTSIEAYRTRVSELEHSIIQHDETAAMQKKIFNEAKEECHEKLKAVESKYKTQLAINRSLEEKIMELYQHIEMTGHRPVHSPDTSSCHEVNATMTDRTGTAPGFSPHSSPLSASFASSEGSMAFIHADIKDMKNLQAYVDQKESSMMIRSSSTIESELNQEASYSATSPGHSAVASTSKTD